MTTRIPALLLVFLAACASDPPQVQPGADAQFTEHASNYLSGYLAFRPVYASRLGMHAFDSELPDYSPKSVEAEIFRLEAYQELFASIPAGRLSRETLSDLEILQASIKAWKSRLEEKPDFRRDPLLYNKIIVEGLEVLLRRNFAPAAVRMEALLSRMTQIPRFLEVARINLTEVPEVLRASSEFSLVNSMYLLRDSLPDHVREQMGGELPPQFEEIHLRAVYAYTDFILFIKDQLKESCIDDYALGEELFLKRWRNEEVIEMDREVILDLCQTTRDSLMERMRSAARLIDPEADLEDVLSRLEDDHTTVKGVSDTAAEMVGKLRVFTKQKDLITIPLSDGTDLRILEPDPRTTALITFLPPGLTEAESKKGYITFNPIPPGCPEEQEEENLRFFTTYSITLLTAGAAYPGNYVQILKAKRTGSSLRKILESATYRAGWFDYCQELVLEAGFDPRPEALLTLLRMSLLEINRLEAATRIHCLNMPLDEARNFLMGLSYITPSMANREVPNIVRNPKSGAGFIGKSQIKKLRELYLTEEGEYNLKRFHDLLLSVGQAPVSIIANRVFGKQI